MEANLTENKKTKVGEEYKQWKWKCSLWGASMKLISMRFSLETDVKDHFGRGLEMNRKKVRLILEKLTFDKNKQIV